MAREQNRLNKIIRPMGFEYRTCKRHGGIFRLADGKRVLTCSSTASDRYWWANVLKDLVRYGHITDPEQKNRLRQLSR